MKKLATAAGLAACATVGVAVLAAPAQDRPGIPTRALVWIENRTVDEAVPVVLTHRATDRPQQVEVVGVPTVAIPAATVVQVRSVPVHWEYRTVGIAAAQDMAAVLLPLGQDGWEVTGFQQPAQAGTTLLLKRAR